MQLSAVHAVLRLCACSHSLVLQYACKEKPTQLLERRRQAHKYLTWCGPSQIFDSKNPYVRIEEYKKQLKNLKWLLGVPFEVYVKVDTLELDFNDAKDDLKDDALRRDSFFASVHAAIALDVLKRMLPGNPANMTQHQLCIPA